MSAEKSLKLSLSMGSQNARISTGKLRKSEPRAVRAVTRRLARRAKRGSTDCAVGSGEWAEPPHSPWTLRRRGRKKGNFWPFFEAPEGAKMAHFGPRGHRGSLFCGVPERPPGALSGPPKKAKELPAAPGPLRGGPGAPGKANNGQPIGRCDRRSGLARWSKSTCCGTRFSIP